LFPLGAICFAALNIQAAPLKVVKVNFPAINCLFSTNCVIRVTDTVAKFNTNLPPLTVCGFLQSRTFEGKPGTHEAGHFGYGYRLVLTRLAGASSISITSMTINTFGAISAYNYNGRANNQVWVETSGGLGSVGPGAASSIGTKNYFRF